MPGARHPPFSPRQRVEGHVDRQNDKTQHHLDPRREASRINERNKVMLDEAAIVPGRARRSPERVFERCQRTDRCAQLRERAPRDGRQVDRSPDGAPLHEHAAEEHEHNEREVDDENRIGGEAEDHGRWIRKGKCGVVSAVVNAPAHGDA